jgi:hypothetical protein
VITDPQATLPIPPSRRSRRLRLIGTLVLLLGFGGSGLVYWLGTRSPDVMDDLSMVGFDRAQRRQMGHMYGKMGLAVEQFIDDFKQPLTQSKLIAGVSIVIAVGCFYLARPPQGGDGPP